MFPGLLEVEVTGFEPATFWSRTKRATKLRYTSFFTGANEGTRTLDLRFTKPLLCQLSYIGTNTAANSLELYHILWWFVHRLRAWLRYLTNGSLLFCVLLQYSIIQD